MKNAMTVDVEDYFHVSAFEKTISPAQWDEMPLRVDENTRTLLDVFDAFDTKATFFILGWVAERVPDLVREIAQRGHEVASHGFNHRRATEQSPEEFAEDVRRSRDLLEDLSGQPVLGYRAPSFSINTTNEWVFDVLKDLGFQYSSSTYPVQHDLYGVPSWPRFRHAKPNGLIEIPLTTLRKGNKNVPIAGGGYFRLYPYALTRHYYNTFIRDENQPAIFYMHPWEFDTGQPRQRGISMKSRVRHYLNIGRHMPRLKRLLQDFQWGRMDDVFNLRGE